MKKKMRKPVKAMVLIAIAISALFVVSQVHSAVRRYTVGEIYYLQREIGITKDKLLTEKNETHKRKLQEQLADLEAQLKSLQQQEKAERAQRLNEEARRRAGTRS